MKEKQYIPTFLRKKPKNVVFIPGFKSDLDYYFNFVNSVAQKHNVFQLEMNRNKKYSLDDYVNEAKEDINRLNKFNLLDEYVVCGHSLGGGVAFELSKDMPEAKAVIGINPLSNTDYGKAGYITRGIKLGIKNFLFKPSWVLSTAKNILTSPIQSYKTVEDISKYKPENVTKPTMILLSNKDEFFKDSKFDGSFSNLRLLPLWGNHINLNQHTTATYVNAFLDLL